MKQLLASAVLCAALLAACGGSNEAPRVSPQGSEDAGLPDALDNKGTPEELERPRTEVILTDSDEFTVDSGLVTALAIDREGLDIVVGTDTGHVVIRRSEQESPVTIATAAKRIHACVFSEDAKYVAYAGDDRSLKIVDADTGEVKHDLGPTDHPVLAMAAPLDGRLCTATSNGERATWDFTTGKRLTTTTLVQPEGHPAPYDLMRFDPQGDYVYAAHGDVVLAWLGDEEEVQGQVRKHDGGTVVDFSAEMDFLATIHGTNTVRTFDEYVQVARSVTLKGKATGVACHPLMFVTADDRGTLTFWGSPLFAKDSHHVLLKEHKAGGRIADLRFSDGGKTLACTQGNKVKSWHIETRPID